jgi:lipoate-protein ligase B
VADFATGVDFAQCLEAQLAARDELARRRSEEGENAVLGGRLFMVEHAPTVTLGRRATEEDVLWDEAQLRESGLAVRETPRGGEATLHAPGQLVAYPVVRVGRRIRAHIVTMAEVTAEIAREYGCEGAEFRMDHPGVWQGERKIASIGIHVSRGVAVQGLSFNIDVEARWFGALVSCGLPQVEMLSLAQVATRQIPPMAELAHDWARRFALRAGYELVWSAPEPTRDDDGRPEA